MEKRFPSTGVRTSCPAVIVPFGTDAKETTEVTPAFLSDGSGDFKEYRIPDCSGGWMPASPDAHNEYVRSVDESLGRKVKPLIRFLKAWKYFQSVPISSFYLELRVAKYASEETSIIYSLDVKRVFAHLEDIELAQIRDPMGVSGLISPCKSGNDLESTKSKVSTALSRATKAREAEQNGDIREAFDWWDLLFAHQFPSTTNEHSRKTESIGFYCKTGLTMPSIQLCQEDAKHWNVSDSASCVSWESWLQR